VFELDGEAGRRHAESKRSAQNPWKRGIGGSWTGSRLIRFEKHQERQGRGST